MNMRTIREKIKDLEERKAPYIDSIEITQARIQTLTDQIKILEEVLAISVTPRRRKERGPNAFRGRNNSAVLKILANATSPMTSKDVQKVWPKDLKPQSVYPTLNDLTKKKKVNRIGEKPYTYTLKDRWTHIQEEVAAEVRSNA